MHDKLFDNRQALTRPDLEKYAQELGLDVAKFKAALDSKKHETSIKADQDLAARGRRPRHAVVLHQRSLPAGAQPLEQFKEIIDDELKRAEKLNAEGVPAAGLRHADRTAAKAKRRAAAATPSRASPTTKTVYKVPVGQGSGEGSRGRAVTMVIFSDFQCPFCSRVEPTITAITRAVRQRRARDVEGQPPSLPRQAPRSRAEAAMPARRPRSSGKSTTCCSRTSARSRVQTSRTTRKQLGLNAKKFNAALDSNTHKARSKPTRRSRARSARAAPLVLHQRPQPARRAARAAFEKRDRRGTRPRPRPRSPSGTPRRKLYDEIIKDGAHQARPPHPQRAAAPDANKIYEIAAAKDAPFKGGKNAKVVIQEFSDFQCPFCGRVARPSSS